ncbi:hypothetical protein [Sinorhizobium medicae]
MFLLFWIFRNEIRPRIKDLVSLGPGGAVLQPTQAVPESSNSALSDTPHPMATVVKLVERLEGELAHYQESSKIPLLVKSLAEARVERAFEWLFGNIFGSQIVALRYLQQKSEITIAEAEEFFENVVKPMDKELYAILTFEDWSRFLLLNELVAMESGKVKSTQIANDFLIFVDKFKRGITRSH